MKASTVAQLVISLGPTALEVIPKLATNWDRQLTTDQIVELCATAKKSYDAYMAEARARVALLSPLHAS
jgi:hypothetical protein